jgi:cation diffusion facilitator CzcD-associated flavoprotein CzcO
MPRRARARALAPPPLQLLLLLLLAALPFAAAPPPPPPAHVRYLVLGAGPGGLQLAHYLESAGRDYLVLDAQARPASFFERFPRWRQLISINKREVGRADSLAFAERHDWNSVLSDASHAAGGFASTTDARTAGETAPSARSETARTSRRRPAPSPCAGSRT